MGGNYVAGAIGYASGSKLDITNTNISLIDSKTYINADEQEVTDNLYISYVNEAVGEAIDDYTFKDELYFGYIYNGTWTNALSNSNVKVNKVKSGLVIIYAKYNIGTEIYPQIQKDGLIGAANTIKRIVNLTKGTYDDIDI